MANVYSFNWGYDSLLQISLTVLLTVFQSEGSMVWSNWNASERYVLFRRSSGNNYVWSYV